MSLRTFFDCMRSTCSVKRHVFLVPLQRDSRSASRIKPQGLKLRKSAFTQRVPDAHVQQSNNEGLFLVPGKCSLVHVFSAHVYTLRVMNLVCMHVTSVCMAQCLSITQIGFCFPQGCQFPKRGGPVKNTPGLGQFISNVMHGCFNTACIGSLVMPHNAPLHL